MSVQKVHASVHSSIAPNGPEAETPAEERRGGGGGTAGSARALEHYSATKRNVALTWPPTWLSLEVLLPGESSQARRVTYCVTPFEEMSGTSQSTDTESR